MKRLIRRQSNISGLSSSDYSSLMAVLNYVYSGGNRVNALNNFSRSAEEVASSSIAQKLPLNMVVTRWYDFSEDEIEEVYSQIEQNGYYQYPYNLYSFSKLDSDSLRGTIRRNNGLVVQKDLSNLSGSYVDVHEILSYFQNENNFRSFIKEAYNSSGGQQIIDFFTSNGIMEDGLDNYNSDTIGLHLEEIAYVEQEEIIIISEDIGKIYENEIIG